MSLFIKKYKNPNGKTYCSIVDGYRINGKVKHSVIQNYGYFEDLNNKHGDAETFLVSELNRLKKEYESKFVFKFDINQENDF